MTILPQLEKDLYEAARQRLPAVDDSVAGPGEYDGRSPRGSGKRGGGRDRRRWRGRVGRLGVAVPLLAAVIVAVVVAAVALTSFRHQPISPEAGARLYPYTLVELGTLGGPSSFIPGQFDNRWGEPGVPLSSQGTALGQADLSTRDSDYPHCPPPDGCSDGYIQHAVAWQDGELTDLGALPGQNSSAIFQQNANGVGVGASEDGLTDPFTKTAASAAVMFENGRVTELGALPGGYESAAQNINDQGQVAGLSSNSVRDQYACSILGQTPPCGWTTEVRAVVWRNGVISDLGTLGGPDALEVAQNDQGEIAGESYTSDQPSATTSVPTLAPFLWKNGHMINLGTLGGTSGQANWLNDRGEVVGQSNLRGDGTLNYNAFLWNGRRMIDLTPGTERGSATWINDQGDVTGYTCGATLDSPCTGFLWRQGKLTILPATGAGFGGADPTSMNDRDQVVGYELRTNETPVIAALWVNGHPYNLNKLIAPTSLRLTSANYINNQGEIVGYGTLPNGEQRMFLLTRNPAVPLPNN
jgi:probable HAF family extracellular repeat protein